MALDVLVVDDSSVMRAMIIKTLRISSLPVGEIHEAGDGEEGLAVLSEQPIDLVLLDLNMPVMDGERMIEAMRENPQMADILVLVVSTEGSFTRISRLREKGAEFVHKPFTPETLRETVAEMTGECYDRDTAEGTA